MTEQKFSIFWFSLRVVQLGLVFFMLAVLSICGLLELRQRLTGEPKSVCDLYPSVFICSSAK